MFDVLRDNVTILSTADVNSWVGKQSSFIVEEIMFSYKFTSLQYSSSGGSFLQKPVVPNHCVVLLWNKATVYMCVYNIGFL